MLVIEEIAYTYAGGAGVSGVSLNVAAGRVAGLVGPNGAGKSTVLRCCLGLQRPQRGRVRLLTPTGTLAADSIAARRCIGYIPELPVLFDDLSAWDHLRFLGMAYDLPEARFRARAEELLRRFGLWERRFDDPFRFSKGMLQKLSIICALLHDPAVILCDEPLSGLDAISRQELLQIFTRLKGEGKAILLCTHHLAAAEQLCDHYLLLHQGQVLVAGDLAAIRERAAAPGASLETCFLRLAAGAPA